MKVKFDLFGYVKAFFTKVDFEEIKSARPVYLANRFLSMTGASFAYASELNERLVKMPVWASEAFLKNSIPRQRPPYIKYIGKGPKVKKSKEDLEQKVMTAFQVSRIHAKQIIAIYTCGGHEPYKIFGVKGKG